MTAPESEQVLALGGTIMALSQVRRLGRYGQSDPRQTEPCLKALLGDYDGDIAGLYGGSDAVQPGLHALVDHLSNPREAELTRYLVIVLALERRLSRNRQHLDTIREGLQRAAAQADYFDSPIHRNVIGNLGDLYSETLSQLRPRIIVRGERMHLEDADNAAMIRALLLSAVRSAALWRAVGGSRWRLITRRRGLIESARELLATT